MSRIQVRRGTSTQWTTANPVLAQGEPGYETNTGRFKIGNGSTAWNSLAYAGPLTKTDIGLSNVDNTADASKNVLSASKLTTARTINGVAFDGTQNITITTRSVQTITAPTTLGSTANTDYVVFSNQNSTVTGGDPDLFSTVTILHMDGSSGSTTFTNSAPGKANWVAEGGAQIQTTNKKFGTGAFSEGTNRYLSAPTSLQTDLTFGTGDFTIEGWFYLGQIGNGQDPMFDWRPSNDLTNQQYFYAAYIDGGGPGIAWIRGQTVLIVNWGTFQNATGWYHVAFARQSGTLRMFVNGSLQGSATDTANYLASGNPRIGALVDPVWPRRPFDEIRITKGLARYTAAFTPPTAAFSDTIVYTPSPDITLPSAVGNTNQYLIKNTGSSVVNYVKTTSSQTINGVDPGATGISLFPGNQLNLISDGSNWRTV